MALTPSWSGWERLQQQLLIAITAYLSKSWLVSWYLLKEFTNLTERASIPQKDPPAMGLGDAHVKMTAPELLHLQWVTPGKQNFPGSTLNHP
jgi:hypothetical protein